MMMEESSEVLHKENETLLEKTKKRRLKTPSQVEALERLYNEHKYPSESIKAQLADEIGLSEKQVSGWFCHRRLKDKNMFRDEAYATGKQDVSSGIVQDRGSVLKQDSCGSTKQGEQMHFDPREVESQRFYGQDHPAGDLTHGIKGKYMQPRYYSGLDDLSSGSSSPSQGRRFSQHQDEMEPLIYSSRSSNYIRMNTIDGNNRGNGGYMAPSGCYSAQDEIENAAIAAVKRQLGRHYREDGPQLGVEFQPLPPAAFDSPIRDPTNEPYYIGDPSSLIGHRNLKDPSLDLGQAWNNCNTHLQGSYPAGKTHFRHNICDSDLLNKPGSYESMHKSSFTKYSGHHSGRDLSMDNTDEDSAGETSKLKSAMNYGARHKHRMGGIRSESIKNHAFQPSVVKNRESSYPKLDNQDDSNSHVLKRDKYLAGRRSNLIHRHNEFLNTENRKNFKWIAKEEKPYRGKRNMECANPNKEKIVRKGKLKGKKTKPVNDFVGQKYLLKAPASLVLRPQENLVKGYPGEMPTSFSEDETLEASSSMD